MTVKIPLAAKLWETPNFVIVESGISAANTLSVPLGEIPDDAFHALVDAWVDAIYKKAGKTQRPTAR